MARFEPMDGTGASLVGRSTREAIEVELSNSFLYEQQHDLPSARSFPWWPAVEARLAALGICPEIGRAERVFPDFMPASRLSEWKHEPSSDGVGVLAQSSMFSPYQVAVRSNDVETTLKWSERLSAEGFEATSLLILRECYWQVWAANRDDAVTLCRAMMKSYIALGRPVFAEVLSRRTQTLL